MLWVLLGAVVIIYAGGYVWARSTGLFQGGVETFAPYGATPSQQYDVKPIGLLSLGIPRGSTESDQQHQQAIQELRRQQSLSLTLWRIYGWMGWCEEQFRRL